MPNSAVPILVAGAINTDLVATMRRAPAAGETITGTGFAIHGGGKAANQAVAAARSGGEVHMVGAIGGDDFGRSRLADLQHDGIDTTWITIKDDAVSGVALIFVEKGGENRIAYVPGATLTVPPGHAVAAVVAIQPSLVLATNELPHDALRALLERAHASGATVVLNAAPDPETARDLLGFVSVLIVNLLEAALLLDDEQMVDPGEAAMALLGLGIGTVIVTAGASGAHIGANGEVSHVPAPPVAVVDTTGAGDTFCGALVAALAAGAGIGDAVGYAVAASSLSVTRAGAQTSIPTRKEILAHLQRMQ